MQPNKIDTLFFKFKNFEIKNRLLGRTLLLTKKNLIFMKKVLLTLSAVALLAVVFSSCKKECYCTTTVMGLPLEQMVGEMSASDCESFDNAAWTTLGYTFECEAR